MHAPPHVREIWDLFLCRACHSNNKYLQRGQLRITYKEIRDALYWMVGWHKMRYSKWDCEKALKWLRKATMITTRKTTKGLIVTICNYSVYQNSKNYESHNYAPPAKATRKPQTTDTIYKNDKNVKNDKKKDMTIFEEARKLFPGNKRGLETEYDYLRKKHTDWEVVIPLLKPAIEAQIAWRQNANGEFRPPWKDFKSWTYNRYWELVLTEPEQAKDNTMELLDKIHKAGGKA